MGQFFALVLLLLTLFTTSSCNKSGGGSEAFGIPEVPIGSGGGTVGANVRVLTIIGGDNQIGAPGVALSDTFRVAVTENGNPVRGAAVSFSVVSGTGGTFSSSLVTTDNAGMAQTTFTPQAGYIGAYSIRASHLTSSALFTVNVEDPAGMDINIFNGDNQTDVVASTLTNPLRVQVLNHSDSTPAVGVTVSFDVVAGNGRINGTSNSVDVTTNAAGIAYVSFKLGTLAGVNSIRASLASSPAVFQTFTATGTVSASLFSLSQSSISASPTSLLANGVALTTLTLTARDVYGNQLTSGGGTVVFTPLLGTLLGSVTDHNNGTYTQSLRAPSSTASAPIIVTASYNGSPLTSSALSIALLAGNIDVTQSTVAAASNIVANGTSTTLVTVTLKDTLGNQLNTGGQTVTISCSGGTLLGSIVDNGDGTYSQLLRSSTVAGTYTCTSTVAATPIPAPGTLQFVPGPASATTSIISATPTTVSPDGISTTSILVTLKDANGNNLTSSSDSVLISTTAGSWPGSVTNNGDGTFSKTLLAPSSPATASVTATLNGTPLTSTRNIYFTTGSTGPSIATSQVDVVGSSVIAADNTSTISVTVTLKDSSNTQLASGGSTVVISTTAGTKVGSIVDNGNGTYTQLIRSTASPVGTVTISATVDGATIVDTASASFYGPISLATSTLSASPSSIEAGGITTTLIVLQAKDVNGVNIPVGGLTDIIFSTTAGTLQGASVTDNGNGTYTQSILSSVSASNATVTATKSAVAFSDTASVEFFVVNNLAGLTIDCTNIATYKNKPAVVDGGTLIMNTRGPNGYCPADFVFTTVILRNSATITHGAAGTGTTSYGLEIQAESLSIDATSSINLNGKGWLSSTQNYFRVPSNTGSQEVLNKNGDTNCDAGGTHGGEGGYGSPHSSNKTYGSIFYPVELGASGGKSATRNPTAGGGQAKIIVSGSLINNGSIKANGADGAGMLNGGAGGSIWINTGILGGSGTISVNGGYITTNGYGGGGGRLAIYYISAQDNFSFPTNILSSVKAYGATGTCGTWCNATQGTVFLKSSTQTYGDLLLNNNGVISQYARSQLNVPSATSPAAISATTLSSPATFADAYMNRSPYVGYYVDPKISQNATGTKSDNQTFYITSATQDVITSSAPNMSAVGTTSDQFELFMILDNLEIRGAAIVQGNAQVLVQSGDIASNNATSASVAGIPIGGFDWKNVALTYDFNTYAAAGITIPFTGFVSNTFGGNVTLKNGTYSLGNSTFTAPNLTLINATVTAGTTKGTKTFNLTGALTLQTTSTLTQTQTSTTLGGTEYALDITAGSLSIDSTSNINANSKGYLATSAGKCRVLGNLEVSNYISSSRALGASHGGWGGSGTAGYTTNTPYGNFYKPYTSGAACNYTGAADTNPGGGIISIDLGSGLAIIDGNISANGGGGSNGAAGGSIYLNIGTLSGNGYLATNGGTYTSTWGGGSGGRIAVHYLNLAGNFSYGTNAIANIRSFGSSGGTGNGSNGTVFLKDKSKVYGDLILNNNGAIPYSSVDSTKVGAYIGIPSNAVTTNLTNTTATFATSFTEHSQASDYVKGLVLNPNITQNGTYTYTDDSAAIVSAVSGATVTTGAGLTGIGSTGNTARFMLTIDNLHLSGQGTLYGSGAMIVREGDILSLNTTTFASNAGRFTADTNLDFNPTVTALNFTGVNLQNLIRKWSMTTMTFDTSTIGLKRNIGNEILSTTGALTLQNTTTLSQAATDDSNEYSIEISAGSLAIDATSTISANNSGYYASTASTCKVAGNQNSLNFSGNGQTATGASHGGWGNTYSTSYSSNLPYGSFTNPYTSGASCNWTGYIAAGGGVIRLNIGNGTAAINGTISANGQGTANHGGAGGSIYINAGAISGTGTIRANGGSGPIFGAGSGGRVAIYYNSLANNFSYPSNIVSNVQSTGGSGALPGSPGTIYLKDKAQTYGDLVVSNLSAGVPNSAWTTRNGAVIGNDLATNTSSAVTATTLSSTDTYDQYGINTGWMAGLYLNPNTAQNGTSAIIDDTLFPISGATGNTITTQSGDMTTLASFGNTFKPVIVLRNLQISGNGIFNTSYPIIVKEGDIISNDTNSINWSGKLYNVTGNEVWPEFQNAYNNITLANSSLTLTNSQAITANSLTLNATTLTSQVQKGYIAINLTGALTLTGSSTITQAQTSTSVAGDEYSVEIVAGSLNIGAGSTISANSKGYKVTTAGTNGNCRLLGNQDSSGWNGPMASHPGASHGGYGGSSANAAGNLPYGSFSNPYTSGASCAMNSYGGQGGIGGGIVRINLGNGAAVIDGTITTNSSSSYGSSAGGSIYLNAGAVSGAGSISASGTGGAYAAGSGGRIAVYYTSLAGNFLTTSSIVNYVKACGSTNGLNIVASPGTIFFKDKAQTYGDMIIHNCGYVMNASGGRYGAVIGAPSAANSLGLTSTTMTMPTNLTEYSIETNYAQDLYVHPNTNENATATLFDDTLFKIASTSGNVLTTTAGNMTTVGTSGSPAKFVAVFNNFSVSDRGALYQTLPIKVINGDLFSGDSTTFSSTNSYVVANSNVFDIGTAINNITLNNTTFSATTTPLSSTGSISILGGAVVTTSSISTSSNLTISGSSTVTNSGSISVGGSLSSTSSTVTTSTASVTGSMTVDGGSFATGTTDYGTNLAVTGNIILQNSAVLKHKAYDGTSAFRLGVTAANLSIDATSSINVNTLGYYSQAASWRLIGNTYYPSRSNSSTATAAGGSYGGFAGEYLTGHNTNEPYGNFTWPIELGAGNGYYLGYRTNGGGAINLNITNTLTNNGTISSNGESGATSTAGGASGGSILIQTSTLTGTGTITANGGNGGSANYGGGSGGRIALYFTTGAGNFSYPTNMINNVTATGGNNPTSSIANLIGGAGTIYLKQPAQTYGDLIVNNGSVGSVASSQTTYIQGPNVTLTSSALSSTVLTKASSFGYGPNAGTTASNYYSAYPLADKWKGYCINPNIAQNGTTKISDDTIFKIISSTDNNVTTAGNLTTVASSGNTAKLVLCLDNLEVRGKGHLLANNINIAVLSGDLSSNNTTSFVQDGGITTSVLDLTTSGVRSTTANATGTITSVCANVGTTVNCP